MTNIIKSRRNRLTAIILIGITVILAVRNTNAINLGEQPVRPVPEFTQHDPASWINSEPLKIADLKNKVVLLDIWTFGCWNCYRSFPWLNDLEKRFEDKGLQIIGIHSPEFDHEKNPESIRAKVKEFGLHHPIMQDDDLAYWRSLNNRYWPAYYLIDKKGRIRALFVGETHTGDKRAEQIEAAIVELLGEKDAT